MNQSAQPESGGSGCGVAAIVTAVILAVVVLGGGCLLALVFFGYSAGAQTAPFTYTIGPPAAVSSATVAAPAPIVLAIEQRPQGLVLVLDGADLNQPSAVIKDEAWAELRARLAGIASGEGRLSIEAANEVPYANVARALEEAARAGVKDVSFAASEQPR